MPKNMASVGREELVLEKEKRHLMKIRQNATSFPRQIRRCTRI